MTKADFITELVAQTVGTAQLTKKQAEAVADAIATITLYELTTYGEALLPGIGKFLVKDRAEREGRNLQTGERITIPAGKRIVFRPVKAAKDAVG